MWYLLFLWSFLCLLPFAFASPHKKVSHTTTTLEIESGSQSVPLVTGPSTRSHPSSQPHTPFSGTPSTTGALTATSVGNGISEGHVIPAATTYPSDGNIHNAEPAPFVPAGGVGTNGSTPVYNTKSDFDYESLVRTCLLNKGRLHHNINKSFRPLHYTKNGLSWTYSRTAYDVSPSKIFKLLV